MPAHSRSKNGVASLAYVAGIYDSMLDLMLGVKIKDVDGCVKPGHDA